MALSRELGWMSLIVVMVVSFAVKGLAVKNDPVDFASSKGLNIDLCVVNDEVTLTTYPTHDKSGTYENPYEGFVPLCGLTTSFPHSLCFVDIAWDDVMTGPSTFDFSSIDTALAAAETEGSEMILRIVTETRDCLLSVPAHLIEGLDTFSSNSSDRSDGGFWPGCGGFSPDYSNLTLLTAMESTMTAIGDEFSSNSRIAIVETGFVGFGGSWRVGLNGGSQPNLPGAVEMVSLVNSWTSAMPDAMVVTPFPVVAVEAGSWGFQDELFGFATYQTPIGGPPPVSFVDTLATGNASFVYLSKPFGGTLAKAIELKMFEDACALCQSYETCIDNVHFTYLRIYTTAAETPWNFAAPEQSTTLAAHARLGYEYTLHRAELHFEGCTGTPPMPMTAEFEMSNTGVAPFYFPLELTFRDDDTDSVLFDLGDVGTMLPNGQHHTFDIISSAMSLLEFHHGGLMLHSPNTNHNVSFAVTGAGRTAPVRFNFAPLVDLPINGHVTCYPPRDEWNFFTFSIPEDANFYIRVAVIKGIVQLYLKEDDFPDSSSYTYKVNGDTTSDARIDVLDNHSDDWHASLYAQTDAIYFVNIATLHTGPLCGNGVVEEGEECDLGFHDPNSCCSIDCQFQPTSFMCRPHVDPGACDRDTYCLGDSFDCPAVVLEPDYVVCDDLDVCTYDTRCLQGVCEQGKVRAQSTCSCVLDSECEDLVNECVIHWCDTNTSFCAYLNRTTGTCDDHDHCTTDDVCHGGGVCYGTNVCPTDNNGVECSGRGSCCENVCNCQDGWKGDVCEEESKIKWWGWMLIGFSSLTVVGAAGCCISIWVVLIFVSLVGTGGGAVSLGGIGTAGGAFGFRRYRKSHEKMRYDPRSELELPTRGLMKDAQDPGQTSVRPQAGRFAAVDLPPAPSFVAPIHPEEDEETIDTVDSKHVSLSDEMFVKERFSAAFDKQIATQTGIEDHSVVDVSEVSPQVQQRQSASAAQSETGPSPSRQFGNVRGRGVRRGTGRGRGIGRGGVPKAPPPAYTPPPLAPAPARQTASAKSLWDFIASQEGEIDLKAGDMICVTEQGEDGWWTGTVNNKRGTFPGNYVELLPDR